MTRSRRWKWWQVALLVTGLALGAGALFLAFVAVTFIGGFDELFRGDPPSEDDPRVVSAEEAATQGLEARASRLVAATEGAMQSEAQLLGGGLVGPRCQVGQHNWKIDDDFDLACDLSRITVIGVEDRSWFHADTTALDAALAADGWHDDGFGPRRVLDDYWVPRYGDVRTQVPVPGTDGYSMEDLPSGRYLDASRGFGHRLEVAWAEPGSTDTQITYAVEELELFAPDGSRVSPRELVARIPRDGYAVVLTESVEYFRE